MVKTRQVKIKPHPPYPKKKGYIQGKGQMKDGKPKSKAGCPQRGNQKDWESLKQQQRAGNLQEKQKNWSYLLMLNLWRQTWPTYGSSFLQIWAHYALAHLAKVTVMLRWLGKAQHAEQVQISGTHMAWRQLEQKPYAYLINKKEQSRWTADKDMVKPYAGRIMSVITMNAALNQTKNTGDLFSQPCIVVKARHTLI